MVCSDGEGLSQLYLELVDAYMKRFIPQHGQGAVLKYSPVWKKSRKKIKTYELKLKFIPKARDSNSTFVLFLFKPDNLA